MKTNTLAWWKRSSRTKVVCHSLAWPLRCIIPVLLASHCIAQWIPKSTTIQGNWINEPVTVTQPVLHLNCISIHLSQLRHLQPCPPATFRLSTDPEKSAPRAPCFAAPVPQPTPLRAVSAASPVSAASSRASRHMRRVLRRLGGRCLGSLDPE